MGSENFQNDLQCLEEDKPREGQSPTASYLQKLGQLTRPVFAAILPCHGYDGDAHGAAVAMAEFTKFPDDAEVRGNARRLNEALGLPQPHNPDVICDQMTS